MTVSVVTITLPLPPPANRMWRHVRGRIRKTREGKIYYAPVDLSDEYVRWLDGISWPVAEQMRHQRPILGCFRPIIRYPERNRRDEDSWAKPVLDGLQRCGVIRNDKGSRGLALVPMARDDVEVELLDLDTEPFPEPKTPRKIRKPRPSRPTARMIARYRKAGVLV